MQKRYRSIVPGSRRGFVRNTTPRPVGSSVNLGVALKAPSLWIPTDFSPVNQPILWFDAADEQTITIATGVSNWRDKSIFGRNAFKTTSTAQQPALIPNELNGKSVIRFDGTDDSLEFDGQSLSQSRHTIFAVVSRRSNKTANYWLGSANSQNQYRHVVCGWSDNTTYRYSFSSYDLDAVVTGYTSPEWNIWVSTLEAAGKRTLRDGTSLANNTQTFVASTFYNAIIGTAVISGNVGRFNGDVAEIVAYRSALVTADRQRVEGYLAHKWGLTSQLAAGHPWIDSAPTTA